MDLEKMTKEALAKKFEKQITHDLSQYTEEEILSFLREKSQEKEPVIEEEVVTKTFEPLTRLQRRIASEARSRSNRNCLRCGQAYPVIDDEDAEEEIDE